MRDEMKAKLVEIMKDELGALVDAQAKKIVKSIDKSGKGKLTIGFNVKLNYVENGDLNVTAGIGFGYRWTDTNETKVISAQPELDMGDGDGESNEGE